VSNEEFPPFSQTEDQARVEARAITLVEQAAARRGLTRRDFLRTTGGVAASLLAMNSIFGKFFDIGEIELFETAAFAEQQGAPYFIFDVQTHYVSSHYDPTDAESNRKGAVSKQALLSLRRWIRESGLNPKLAGDRGAIDDLSWRNFVKEVFLDSETTIGLISTPPGPYPQEAVVPPNEMAHIRDEINRLAQSQRMLAHGLPRPNWGQPIWTSWRCRRRRSRSMRGSVTPALVQRDSIVAGGWTMSGLPIRCWNRRASSM
jgi:hypothetical protein